MARRGGKAKDPSSAAGAHVTPATLGGESAPGAPGKPLAPGGPGTTGIDQAPGPRGTPATAGLDLDPAKFENIHQIGGIRLGTLEHAGQPVRCAFVDTGSGFRFTVALDRGGDVVDAFHGRHSLAYLSPNGLVPPNVAYHRGLEWLRGWAGGLVTTCGPRHVGSPREEDGETTSLHGHHSNTPATLEMLTNPDPHRGRYEMLLSMIVRDSRMFGPTVEVRRQIQCILGRPQFILYDQVTNRGDRRTPHAWLYHVNFGYPLLDRDARFIYRGPAEYWHAPAPAPGGDILRPLDEASMNAIKRVPDPLAEHAGSGERGLIVVNEPDGEGMSHVGLINDRLGLGVELEFPAEALPRVANWQHYGPRGSYVTGLEPFAGSLLGKAKDKHPAADLWLEPGETRRYQMTVRVLTDTQGLEALEAHDGPVAPKR